MWWLLLCFNLTNKQVHVLSWVKCLHTKIHYLCLLVKLMNPSITAIFCQDCPGSHREIPMCKTFLTASDWQKGRHKQQVSFVYTALSMAAVWNVMFSVLCFVSHPPTSLFASANHKQPVAYLSGRSRIRTMGLAPIWININTTTFQSIFAIFFICLPTTFVSFQILCRKTIYFYGTLPAL